jgi:hypothetical protein
MRAQRRCTPPALLVLSGLTFSNQARADHQAEDKATAQVLFDQGRAAVKQGNFSDACPKFAESQRLDPGIGTLLWLGDCYENVGQTATAWATFKEAAAAAKLQHDNREQVARDRINKLEPTLPHVTILVRDETAIPKLEILRDGVPVGTAQWGIAVPVDPGTHTIVARAPGRQDWSQTIRVESQKDSIDISVPELDAAPASAGSPSETSGSSEPNEKGPSVRWSSQYTLAIVTGAVGVLGVGLGTYFSFAAKSAYDSSNSGVPPHCVDNRCDPTGLHDRSDAFDKAALSTAMFVASAATLAGGALLYFTAPSLHAKVTVAPSPSAAIARFTMNW